MSSKDSKRDQSIAVEPFPRHELSGISELVFLDRYAMKDPQKKVEPGDLVVVLTKEDPKFPQKEIGTVRAVDGDQVTVELRNTGELFTQERKKLDRCVETSPTDMWNRMAKAIVELEDAKERPELETEFRWLLEQFRFSPGGRINTMLGTNQNLTAYNCYVIPIKAHNENEGRDSRQSIIDTLGNMVEIMSRGGGVGINLSTLRPRLAYVEGVNGRSSGSVSWGALFSFATGLVEQGGSRRGALMLILDDWHPDILEFIHAKRDMGAITNANISVGISDAFMEAVESDAMWDLVFPDTKDPDYDRLWDGNLRRWREEHGKPVKVYKQIRAREIWDTLMESAWMSAEPGVVFLERMNQFSNAWYFEDLIATNPCGEQPLPGWGVCNLGHINLSRFTLGKIGKARVDWDSLKRAVHHGVRFLDNIIDITPYFFEENETVQRNERRIGMGTLGLGEMLIRLGLRYGDKKAIAFIDKLYEFIATEAYLASTQLAKEKGPFPAFDADKYLESGFMKTMPKKVRKAVREHGVRNVCILTQAPTGSTGTMIGTSTGIEPYYSWTYWRNSRLGLREVQERIVQEYFDDNPKAEQSIDNLPEYFVTSMELSPQDHIRVQAAVQRWTDSSISKTANAPNDYTIEQTRELYEFAYKSGCKGVTIYRDGSRDQQVLSTTNTENESQEMQEEETRMQQGSDQSPSNGAANQELQEIEFVDQQASRSPAGVAPGPGQPMRKRPKRLTGTTYEWATPLGKAFVTLNEYNGTPVEVFVNIGKAGSDVAAMSEALGRLTTMFLKFADIEDTEAKVHTLIKHLSDIGGSGSVGFGQNRVSSVPDAVAKTLVSYLEANGNGEKYTVRPKGMDLCPSCGQATLRKEEGCYNCVSCGYSKC